MRALYVRGERAEYATIDASRTHAPSPSRAHDRLQMALQRRLGSVRQSPVEVEDRVSASREHDLAALLCMRRSAATVRIAPARSRR